MDITRLVRLRRRCVFGALVGYIVAGKLVLFGFYHPAFVLLAVAVALTSWRAECGHGGATVLQSVLAIPSIVFIAWAYLDFFAAMRRSISPRELHLISQDLHWGRMALGVMAAGGVAVLVWSLVSAVTYNRMLRASVAVEPRRPLPERVARTLVFLRSSSPGLMAGYLALSLMSIAIPLGAIGYVIRKIWRDELLSLWWFLPGIVGSLACLAAFRWALARATRVASLNSAQVRQRDLRPSILLLRSFRDDLAPVAPGRSVRTWRAGAAAVRERTLEERLEEVLWTYGPVIAVGRPGEALPPAGAAREYLVENAWRSTVHDRIAEARVVVVILGQTEGLLDEYRMLAEPAVMPKVVAVFPPVAPVQRAARWATFARMVFAGGSAAALDVSRTLVARQTATRSIRLITCDWNDEECYRLALRCALTPSARGGVSARRAA